MNLFVITIAYCPAALLARCLILYRKTRKVTPYRHIVVQGHYPINEKKNTHDIKLVTSCFSEIELWDPGANLGSAQSQNWALSKLHLHEGDYFINLDPDSACSTPYWDEKMKKVLDKNPNCVLISCLAPMVQRYLRLKNERFTVIEGVGTPKSPTPFNLSCWRYSFTREIGGIPQIGLDWGETEAAFYMECQRRGKYHAYLMDYLEDESGKHMQDKEHNQYKDATMRNPPPGQTRFYGHFDEYLRKYYPDLLEIDTCKDLSDFNFP